VLLFDRGTAFSAHPGDRRHHFFRTFDPLDFNFRLFSGRHWATPTVDVARIAVPSVYHESGAYERQSKDS